MGKEKIIDRTIQLKYLQTNNDMLIKGLCHEKFTRLHDITHVK